jgi:hypothetical protein
MRSRGCALVLSVLALVSVAESSRGAPGSPEVRFDLLLPSLDAGLRAARSATAFDPVTLIEAEETAAVAEELLAEGESEVAVQLLEQAIALLPAPPPE